ncbi:hypothetical protein [Mitsuaria sp. TWR114]|uniref:hypothetical protein n=1 Tax=Mitsuaria sp. TWR114 TaxID=2601731 RepID=UPI002107398F|nr:hypothetical protein [Mitsuaria sp. TWR114]
MSALPHPLPRPARRPATTPPRVDPDATFLEGLRAHRALFDRLDALGPDIARAAMLMSDTLRAGRKLMLMGNGGSPPIASTWRPSSPAASAGNAHRWPRWRSPPTVPR